MYDKLPNGAIERQIRRCLKQQGMVVGPRDVRDIELIAVERPGWKQIFRFVYDRPQEAGNKLPVVGICYDDHRSHCKIALTNSPAEFEALLQDWGPEMIRRRESTHEYSPLSSLLGLCLVIAAILSVVIVFNP